MAVDFKKKEGGGSGHSGRSGGVKKGHSSRSSSSDFRQGVDTSKKLPANFKKKEGVGSATFTILIVSK